MKPGRILQAHDGYKVEFDRILNHPIDKVWQAITDPGQLKYWFTDIEMEFKPGGKLTIIFRDDAKTRSYGEILRIDPPHRFEWTWEGELAVWQLEQLGDHQTRLIFTYSRLAPEYAVKAPAGFHIMIDRLEDRLKGSSATYPFGTEEYSDDSVRMTVFYAASVYDTYPELVTHKPVVVERVYDAPVEKVWTAITDRSQMKQWYFDLDAFELKEGFQFRFPGQGHKGEQYMHVCTITQVEPEKKLQYSWQYEGFPGYSLVTFDLMPVGNKTKLRLTHHGLETFPKDSADFAHESFNEGWNHLIGISLPEHLAANRQ